MALTESISAVKGIGEKTEKLYQKLNIYTKQDLVFYYPRSYELYGETLPIAGLREGDTAAVEAVLCAAPEVKLGGRFKVTSCMVKDASGMINITWFNMPFLRNTLKTGTHYIFRGKVARKGARLRMEQPQILTYEEYYKKKNVLQPVYPLTEGLTSKAISKAVTSVLPEFDTKSLEYLPSAIRKTYDLQDLKHALAQMHFPKNQETMLIARRRLVFDEFFLFLTGIRQLKEQRESVKSPYPLQEGRLPASLLASLPFALTAAQQKVWKEIRSDMAGGSIMNRLVQGDVGSGKTVIAALALCLAVEQGCQGCLMVPTEVLAKQHQESFTAWLAAFGVRVELLVGSMTPKQKREAYARIEQHEADIIIGTHALIQEKVKYHRLALAVTDEQHRFGVRQREKLAEKGDNPHILVMSATPIPRTLAIILYGDLDVSLIDELPADRLPIKNCVVNTSYRETAYRFLEKEAASGHQAYVICPMVEESENFEAENVIDYTERLKEALPKEIRIEYLHGQMKPIEKNLVMEAFAEGHIQILVSTTVVEVGVNVPNATVMMIENAERFGLAQLHQLRGRVGRGKAQSYCILMAGNESKATMRRLEVLNHSNDGFFIAEEDLKLRGPGDLFGIRQSGDMDFALADIYQDAQTLKQAAEAAGSMEQKELLAVYEQGRQLYQKQYSYEDAKNTI